VATTAPIQADLDPMILDATSGWSMRIHRGLPALRQLSGAMLDAPQCWRARAMPRRGRWASR
jgi:hypothetical protein